jgi:hypothetical protein
MAEGSGKLPVIACARDSWLYLRDHWRLFLPAAAVASLIAQVGYFVAVLGGTGGQQTASGTQLGDIIMSLPALFASLMFAAVVLRKFLRNEFIAPVGLAFGADELRLLAVVAAFACMIIPLGTLAVLIVSLTILPRLATTEEELAALLDNPDALNEALLQALGPGGTTAFMLFVLLVFGAAIYLFTRLFMVNAATIGERRVVMFQTWSWSRGNVLRMLGAILLTWLPAYLIDSMVLEVGLAVIRPLAADGNAGVPLLILNTIATFVAAMVGIPSIVLGGILYKGLRPADFVAK